MVLSTLRQTSSIVKYLNTIWLHRKSQYNLEEEYDKNLYFFRYGIIFSYDIQHGRKKMTIKGVDLINLTVHEDDRGYLYEIVHSNDPFLLKFGQVYLVGDPVRNTIRAFHKHSELHDYFCIIHGSAKFILKDDRQDSPTYKAIDAFILSSRSPKLLVVPPGIYHGWMSLEDDTVLISTASHLYNREKPDEERIPPDSFGDLWVIKGR